MELTEEQKIILDLFSQCCYNPNTEKYFHQFISAFEDAQFYLLEKKIIKKKDVECL